MNNIEKEINTKILQEVGFEIGPRSRIYDQDTGLPIQINGMDVVAPGCFGGRKSMEFDPYNNRRLMSQVFSAFIDKYSEESDIDIMTYYDRDNEKDGGRVECRLSNNEIVTSEKYSKDSLKYIDIIMQLNGEDSPNLSKYDIKYENETIKRKKKIVKKG